MTTNFEPHECLIYLKSTKIGTHENKAIHSISVYLNLVQLITQERFVSEASNFVGR